MTNRGMEVCQAWDVNAVSYRHTQYGYLHILFYAILLAIVPLFWAERNSPGIMLAMSLVGGLFLTLSWMFQRLTIEDRGDRLLLSYGPLPAFWKSIRYQDMTRVEPGRTSVIDGWGIHWIPGRGTTYNLWGFGCVVVHLGKRVIRIGTNDVQGLAAFLSRKVAEVHGADVSSAGRD